MSTGNLRNSQSCRACARDEACVGLPQIAGVARRASEKDAGDRVRDTLRPYRCRIMVWST